MTGHALLDTSVLIAPPSAGLASLTDAVAISLISVAELQASRSCSTASR